MTVQKLIHNREHVPMGCGPMTSCAVCRSTFGDVVNITDSSGVTQAIPTMDEMIKYVILGMIGAVATTLVTEKFVKPVLLKEKGEKNPSALVKTKRDERLWKRAKKAFARQRRKKKIKSKWGYITATYERMKGD